jgi:hypothetical protein
MSFTTRFILILTLVLPLACGAFAQEETPATTATTTATETVTTTDTAATATAEKKPVNESSYETRNRFSALLRDHPPEVAQILVLDPTLMSNEEFLSGHPRLQTYLTDHPEVLRQPRFYLAEFSAPVRSGYVFDELIEIFAIVAIWAFMAFALGWFIRTWIEQRRWKQLTKTQSEVHNKILDRFGSSEEVLAYIKTPAGTKFLESAPIPLHVEKPAAQPSGPHMRVIWSIQLGVIAVAAALGMLLISLRFEGENAHGLFALGAIALSIGVGFIASAAVSIVLSRRLGLWTGAEQAPATRVDETGLMR